MSNCPKLQKIDRCMYCNRIEVCSLMIDYQDKWKCVKCYLEQLRHVSQLEDKIQKIRNKHND